MKEKIKNFFLNLLFLTLNLIMGAILIFLVMLGILLQYRWEFDFFRNFLYNIYRIKKGDKNIW